MIAARVYTTVHLVYQVCGAGAGADADQAGELQSAPTPPKTRRLESGLCPWEPGLKCFGVRKWVRVGGWAGALTGRYFTRMPH